MKKANSCIVINLFGVFLTIHFYALKTKGFSIRGITDFTVKLIHITNIFFSI